MIARVRVRALAAVLLLSPSLPASAQQICPTPKMVFDDDPVVSANERRLWAETLRIVRLPAGKQAAEIGHVYRDVLSELHPRIYPLANWHVRARGGPDYIKSLVEGRLNPVGSMYSNMYAQQVSLALLAAYPKEAQPLIQRDLRDSRLDAIERGLFVAAEMTEARFPGLYDDMKSIFLRGRECSDKALNALFSYGDLFGPFSADARPSRVHELRPVLVARFRSDPWKYANYLTNLLSVGPVPGELLTALESDDSMLREPASHAVISSRDPRLAPYVRRMLADTGRIVRMNGFSIGFAALRRGDAAYKDIEPSLEPLMRDPVWIVRLRAIESFTFGRDAACVPVLRDLLNAWAGGDPTIPDQDFGQVAVYVEAITRQKFGFGDRALPPRQDPANARAIERFSNWVKARRP